MEINRGAGRTFDMQQLDALSTGGEAYTDKDGGLLVIPSGQAPAEWSRLLGALTPMANKQLYAAMMATGHRRAEQAGTDPKQAQSALRQSLAEGMKALRQLRSDQGRPPPTNDGLMAFGIARMALTLRVEGPITVEDYVAMAQRHVVALPPNAAQSSAATTEPAAKVAEAVKQQMKDAELDSRYAADAPKLATETENRLKAANPHGWHDRKVSASDIQSMAKAVVAEFNDWATSKDRDTLARPDLHMLD